MFKLPLTQLLFYNYIKCSCVVITDTLWNAHGNYTPNTIKPDGKVAGPVGRALDAAFHENVCETDVDESYRKRYDYSADIATFCTEYKDVEEGACLPARVHRLQDLRTRQFHPTATEAEATSVEVQ